jgi:hypothetical protein
VIARLPGLALVLVGLIVHVGCTTTLLPSVTDAPSPSPEPTISVDSARTELVDLIVDVEASTAHRYRVTDNLGRWLGPTKIVWIPEASTFAASYFTTSDDGHDRVQVATSTDLMNWTWRVELADQAAMPAIASSTDGGYVLAWEQEPDPIHMVIAYFSTWEDVLAGSETKRFEIPITMPACGEGTPSIEAASSERVDLGFHYHGDCERDRQAGGSSNWTSWQSTPRPALDEALASLGVDGHLGDRDTVSYHGHDLMLIEGQRVLDDWSSWRTFIYDAETNVAEQIDFRTHAGSVSLANPSITEVEINGRAAMVVTLYIFTEGARGNEDGELIYYRYL